VGFGVFTFLALTTSMDQLDPCWDEAMGVLTCRQLYEGAMAAPEFFFRGVNKKMYFR